MLHTLEPCPLDASGPVLSLAGCAWGVPYHFGVAAVLRSSGRLDDAVYVGASSGALAAAGLAAGLDPAYCFEATLASAQSVVHRRRGPAGRMSALVREALQHILPEDAHERVRGRFFASVTALPGLGSRLCPEGHLYSKRDLIELVLASCYIPLYYERPAWWRGAPYLDGGLRDNQPTLGRRALTVSPFRDPRRPVDISPSTPSSKWRALWPSQESLRRLFEQGQRDAETFLRRTSVGRVEVRGPLSRSA